MRITTNDCVGCPTEMGCLGACCKYANVEHIYCDKCNCEIDGTIHYTDDGRELCSHCMSEMEAGEE